MKKFFIPFACALMIIPALTISQKVQAQSAQVEVIRGRIFNSKDKTPINGASITEMDKDDRIVRGVSTDMEGNFALRLSDPRNKITISFIGYKTLEIKNAGSRTNFNIGLEPSNTDLTEVVVVSQKKVNNGMMAVSEKDRTTAVTTIQAKDLEEMQAASIDQALVGRMPGVDITAASGDPGAALSIKIRGTSSINSSDNPLIVVDGMPIETEIPADFNFGTADEQGYAALLNIAPSDIKDISVLRDAAATAVWGSRASSGVLIINTKRGAVGKPSITYTFKGSLTKAPEAIPMLNGNQFSMLIPEMVMNRTGAPLNTLTQKEFNYDPSDPYWYKNYSNNTDWLAAITRTGNVQDHNVSITGGGSKARYYASVGFFNQNGITIGTALSRISTRINLDYNVSERIRFRTDLAYTHSDNDRSYSETIRNVAYNKMPNMSIYEYDKYGNQMSHYFSPTENIQGRYSGTYNPVAMAAAAKNKIVSERIIPHFNLQYDIVPKRLQLTSDVQFDINNTKNKSFLPQVATGRPWTETVVNRAYDGDADAFNVQSKTSLSYTPQLPDQHSLVAFATFQTNDYKYMNQQALTSNTASSELTDVSNASRTANSDLNISSTQTVTRSVGALVSSQYSFKDRYILNLGLRGDGNSRFGPNNRYGLFPSISTRYRVSDELFMKSLRKWVDDLSFRASYGHTGKAPSKDYGYFNTYNTFNYPYLDEAAVYPSTMKLNNLRWETTKGTNLGANLILFQRRLTVDLDFYKNRVTDMFYPGLQISSFTGFDRVDMNVGTMDNQGWEVSMNATLVKKKAYTLDFNFNIAHNENIIREISEYYPREKGNIEANGQYKSLLQINNPFGSFYGFRYKGVYTNKEATIAHDEEGKPIIDPNGNVVYMRFAYPKVDYTFQPGDAIYEDVNHDGNINHMDVVYLGSGNPKFTGGFGPTFTWKRNLKITAFFNYRLGSELINGTSMTTTNMYGFNNQSTAVLKRWQKEGDVTDIPRAIWASGYNWLGSDRYVEDGSFVRFRTVTARYTLTPKFLKKMKIKAASVYCTAENLVTFTRYTGQDPEVSVKGSDPFRVAIDNSTTPPAKSFTIGLTTTF